MKLPTLLEVTRHHRCFSRFLNLAIHGKVYYLWPMELSKSFSPIDYVNIYLSSIFFAIDFARWKSVGLPCIAYIVIH